MDHPEIDTQAREAVFEAIKHVASTLQHATQNALIEEFTDLFRADAIWTTGGDQRLFGRDEISAFRRQVLPGGMSATR